MSLLALISLPSNSFIVWGLSEKKATSEAEIIAEQNKSNMPVSSDKPAARVMGWTAIPAKVEYK